MSITGMSKQWVADLILAHLDTKKRADVFALSIYGLLKDFMATPMRDNISEEKWMAILHSLQDEDVEAVHTGNARVGSM
ncbi:hypothetical protein Gohar_007374 [Gossypium harknessii]|uniref:Uncharacterized protein n=1 Tax=Gossypium harknessii TaxID=34285 RepID=A0A7J9GGB5_9ROSI|nr:hypothetical protein [Gossypium harknessii]